MKAISRCLFALARVTSFLVAMSMFAQPNKALLDKEPFHPTRILVKFAARQKAAGQDALLQQQGLKIQRQFSLLPQVAVLDFADENEAKAAKALAPADRSQRLQQRIAALRATGLFDYVEPDYVRRINAEPSDTAFADGTLWALLNLGQNGGTAGADIGAVAAWDITTGSTNVIVAVVDTGIRYTHQDLAAQMWRDPAATNSICGTNSIAGNSDPMDDNGHGTHVAGTIGAAANNGAPNVGVAWNVRLMACKLLDATGGASNDAYVSDEIACLEFAQGHGARVINASYGGYYYSQSEFEALRDLRDHGVLFVAAAGNENRWLPERNNDVQPVYPASYQLENVIAVAATDRNDNLADFSHYGRNSVHLGAPGVDIYSCFNTSDSAYATESGTSMAAPHVVGAAALILARYPSATVAEVRRRLLNGAVPLPSLTNYTVTGGRLNVSNSLVAVPTGSLTVEMFPHNGQALAAGRSVTLEALITDLLPVTNATVTAAIAGFTNLSLLDGGVAPDDVAGDAIYTAGFLVPTNQSTLQVVLQVSAPGWQHVSNLLTYPIIFPPANDNFANRIAISTNLCEMTVTGSNFNASKEPGEPNHASPLGGRSVWWSWTAPFAGPVKMSTAGSALNTLLAVYTGSIVTNLAPVASNDNAGYYDGYSVVTFNATLGTEYQIAVDGYAAGQGQIVLQVLPLTSSIPLSEALNKPEFKFTSGGDVPWLGQTCITHDGTNAARSGPIEAYGQSWMETTVTDPGILSFWWKVSSQLSRRNEDVLLFYFNGVAQWQISGEVDWQQKRFRVGAGDILRWLYSKDEYGSRFQDNGWVDEISLAASRRTIPNKFGDLDGDGQPTVLDMTLLVGYLRDTNSLQPEVAVFADVNTNGLINSNDIPALADAIMGRSALPPVIDSDGDGIPDVLEPLMGLNPTNKFSLGDGIPDGDRDFDMDGLSNARELALGTDPMRADTDGDGWWDEAEMTVFSDPLDANSRPYAMAVAAPSVALLLPGSINTVVAAPPVTLLLPGNMNTVVAAPPVALLLPATNNTVIARPPVQIRLEAP